MTTTATDTTTGQHPAPTPARQALVGRGARRLWRGRPTDPAWVRPALLALLTATAVLYLWDLSASGWANSYYAAAAQAASQSWSAWFFGSLDAAGGITVDKTPAALWVMGLSARVFGESSWSILVPQALEGVVAVGLLYATVRRQWSPAAGLLAGAVLALTPVATLMFRFNNPDALLVLLLVAAVYATTRALESGSTGWLVFGGALIGFGFLTKMLQALLIVPVLAAVWLLAAPTPLGRRLWQLAAAAAATIAAAGWWVAVVELWPAASRPYIGGSQTNSVLELTLGYNGLGRLTGEEAGSVGGQMGWGETGLLRLFNAEYGGQASWLLPAALVLLAFGLWAVSGRRRTDLQRASLLLWGGWLVITALVFSLMQGIIHPYYAVALAPAIGALTGIGATALWARRDQLAARVGLALALAVTALWAAVLLGRATGWNAWLTPLVVVAGVGAALVLVWQPAWSRATTTAIVAAGLVGALAAPAAASVATAATPHSGALPSASPVVATAGPGGGPPGGGTAGPQDGAAGQPPAGLPGAPGTGVPGGTTTPGAGAPAAPAAAGGGPGGGLGGLLDATTPSDELVALLQQDAGAYRWAAATVGANNAAGPQLASGEPVLAIGGFNGSDPSPTLAEFQQLVADGAIHWYIAGGDGPGGRLGADGTSQAITRWVAATFPAQQVDGVTVYDLSPGRASE